MRPTRFDPRDDLFAGDAGQWCHDLARELWPIDRSLTGEGVRETLRRIAGELPGLTIHAVPSGTAAFDWTVPEEWAIRAAYIEDESGRRIVDFADNNLHVVGYSEPVDTWMTREELDKHLYSLPAQPDAIPYVTSYYRRRWGFCLTQAQRDAMGPGRYHVVVDADLFAGVLNYGELLIEGQSKEEIFLSTYVCHPSMANNELSGPVVTTALAKWIAALPDRRYSYRIVFIPETIGSIVYLSRNLDEMKPKVVAGYNITCVGDDRAHSYIPSRAGDTLADRVGQHVLKHIDPAYVRYSWLDRGSDERQYCAPGVDLPVASIIRTKYGRYPEYHTSLDDLERVVTPNGLRGGLRALQQAVFTLETNFVPRVTTLCEPQLGKRGLYPDLSIVGSGRGVRRMMDMISHCDGTIGLLEIAEKIDAPYWELLSLIGPLVEHGLVVEVA